MTFSEDCLDLVKRSEGCLLNSYQDVAGVLTIGFGHAGKDVKEGITWTQQQADLQLAADLEIAANAVSRLVLVPLTQGQFDALTDFCFNLGEGNLAGSTLLKLLNMSQYANACRELVWQDEEGKYHGWVDAAGKVQPGLVTRRLAEQALWEKEG
jgi:lysozyme